VAAKARGQIEVALLAEEVNSGIGSGVKRLAAEAAAEYHDRFLIELIQNAHDAHSRDRSDGVVHVLFDADDGSHGVLYVANGGRPFTDSNFETISELGLSDKLPSEAIGNKGIGFKSVLQVCERPEIYSASGDGSSEDGFGGYCFSFATDRELLTLVGGDRAKLGIVRRRTALFHLPVFLRVQPPRVRDYAARDAVTVIRLPLDRAGARADVERQLDELESREVPLLLFLGRLKSLTIERRIGGDTTSVELRRTESSADFECPQGLSIKIVDLEDEGRFLTAAVPVRSEAILAAIKQAHSERQLDDRWLEWEGDSEVTAAVRLDAIHVEGRFYAFLPMAVASPFSGHLNAPFYAKLNRRDLSRSHSLNRLFLDAGARACALAALALSRQPSFELAAAATDLISWRDREEIERLRRAFEEAGIPLRDAPLLPVVSRSKRARGSLDSTFRWPHPELRMLTASRVAQAAGVDLLDPQLGPDRVTLIEALHREVIDQGMAPQPSLLADWVEAVATKDLAQAAKLAVWQRFYRELPTVLEHGGMALHGRRILLDDRGVLQRCGRPAEGEKADWPIVFFPPVRDTSGQSQADAVERVSIPHTLRRRIVFMNGDLVWRERSGSTQRQTEARAYLEVNGLVQPYEARTLLERLRDITRTAKHPGVFRDALQLAFRLDRGRSEDDRPSLGELSLQVPTRCGWLAAARALFSAEWPSTLGAALERLIERAAGASPEIAALQDALLLPPADWPFKIEPDAWVAFLRKLGVGDGLVPSDDGRRGESAPADLTPNAIARQVDMPDTVARDWCSAVEASGAGPSTWRGWYRVQTPLYRLPGQGDVAQLNESARREYAALVLEAVSNASSEHLKAAIRRVDVSSSAYFDPFEWPTPFAGFLAESAWLPEADPVAAETAWVQPRSCWHFDASISTDDGAEYARPDYAPLLSSGLRSRLSARPSALAVLAAAGLNVWNDPQHASRLVTHLACLVAEREIPEHFVAHLRKAHSQAWENVIRLGLPIEAGAPLLVRQRAAVRVVRPAELGRGTSIYVRDGGSRLADSVLQHSSRLVLDVESRIGAAVADTLAASLDEAIMRTSELVVIVLADGSPVEPAESAPRLLDGDWSWLDRLVVAVLELKSGAFRRTWTTGRERVLATLEDVRLRFAAEIVLKLGDETLKPPFAMREAVPMHDGRFPTLVVASKETELTWASLSAATPALCDVLEVADLTDSLRLAVQRLADLTESTTRSPTIEELAEALDEPPDEVATVLSSLQGSVAVLAERIAPIIWALKGETAAVAFLERAEACDSDAELMAVLEGLAVGADTAALVAAARASSVDELRQEVKLSLKEINDALRGLDRQPIHYADEHRAVFAQYLGEQRVVALDRLRHAFLSAYQDGGPLDDYVTARDAYTRLSCDPAWLDDHETPPTSLMAAVIDRWLTAALDRRPESSVHLAPLDELRQANRAALAEFLGPGRKLVIAWCEKHGQRVPEGWDDPALEREQWDLLLARGLTDFEAFSVDRLADWFKTAGLWPAEMPSSLDPEACGVTGDDLARARTEEELAKARQAFERRSIEIAGSRHSAEIENYAKLAQIARESISETFLRARSGFSRLEKVAPRSKRPHAPGRVTAVRRSLTETQRAATGLVGEVLALEWLKRHYSGANEESWRSGYRDHVLGGKEGDDSLGYDFEVPSGTTTLYFEVKSTAGDQTEIEFSDRELIAARNYARGTRYRILYIPNVLDPSQRSIHVLPNPFSERARDFYNVVGSGLRYRFSLDR
jgi:hypothetical protein